MKKGDNRAKSILLVILIITAIGFIIYQYYQTGITGLQIRRLPDFGPGGRYTSTTIPFIAVCTDNDHDGFGQGCLQGNDCDDSNININPGEKEICGNSIDEDCDGSSATCPTNNVDLIIDANNYLIQGQDIQITQ